MYPWFDRAGRFSWLKMTVFAGIVIPALWTAFNWAMGVAPPLAQQALPATGSLSAMPVTEALHQIGLWSLRLLIATLAVTPLRRIGRWPRLVLVRRMLGVAAFSYVVIHLFLYVVQQNFRLGFVATEIVLRIYLSIGFVAMLGLFALAVTSTDRAMRRLGGKKWQRLHYLVYPLTALGLAHFFLQSKINVTEPVIMAGLYLWLMLYRLAYSRLPDQGLGLRHLLGLAVTAALLTMLGEAAWYQLATSIGGERILRANLDLSRHVRPAWWIFFAGLGIAALKVGADTLWNRGRAGTAAHVG